MAIDERIIRLARESAQARRAEQTRISLANAQTLNTQNEEVQQEIQTRRAQEAAKLPPAGVSRVRPLGFVPMEEAVARIDADIAARNAQPVIVRRPDRIAVHSGKSGPAFRKP